MRNGKKADFKERLKLKGATELDFRKILFTDEEVRHARGVVAAGATEAYGRTAAEDAQTLMEHLGLMPDQIRNWSETEDKLARRPSNG